MVKTRPYLLLISLLLLSCICLAQSRRQPPKTNNPKVAGPTSSETNKASTEVSATNKTGLAKIPLLIALSRQRRLVMLPPSNEFYAKQIVKSLGTEDRLTVEFDPRKVKVEDAQDMLRARAGTYMLL